MSSPKNIAIIVSDMHYFNASVCAGVYRQLAPKEYKISIYLTHENEQKEKEYLTNIVQTNCIHGIILFSCLSEPFFYYELLPRIQIPIVFVDRLLPLFVKCNFVTVDNYGGAYKIGKKLIEKGARNIACLSMLKYNKLSTIEDRINGFRDSHINEKNIACYREELEYEDITQSMALKLKQWEQKTHFPDAIFATNHLIMNAFISLLPQNKNWQALSQNTILSCFDNLPYFDWVNKPIISVEQPIENIVLYVCNIIRKRIEQKDALKSYANIILPVKLIDRYESRTI